MPPVAKPTHVIVHRIEMQKTEREILEGAAIAKGVGDILGGVGAVLAPFSNIFGAIFAAWIAKEGIEDVMNWARKKVTEKDRKLEADWVLYVEAHNAAVAAGGSPESGPPITLEEYKKKFSGDYVTNLESIDNASGSFLGKLGWLLIGDD